jgi:predicted ATPase
MALIQRGILRIVLTGGPCGGKSSLHPFLAQVAARHKLDFYLAPEVPTIMQLGGCKYPGPDAGQALIDFESALLRLQLAMEDSFAQVAGSTGRPSLVVHDRGLMDVSAYLPRPLWLTILRVNGWSEALLLSRYDAVVHMTSTAVGREDAYTTANNTARGETPAAARQLDAAVASAWEAHGARRVIANAASFEAKALAAAAVVERDLVAWLGAWRAARAPGHRSRDAE